MAKLALPSSARQPVYESDLPPKPLTFKDPNSRAAQILADIFPACEMAELYHTGASRAKVHSDATLLFADMVGFTAWSARQTPDRVFSALTLYYQLLDS